MNAVLTFLTWLVRLVADWLLLAARVRTMLTNDLPHLHAEQQAQRGLIGVNHDLITEQIGYCRGRVSAGECREPSTLDPE